MRLVEFRGVWCAYWREDGKPKRISLGTKDREEAARALIDLKARAADAVPRTLIGDIVDGYLADREHRASDIEGMRFAWKRAKAAFAHLRPDQVTRTVSREYTAAQREAGRSDGTIRKTLGLIQAATLWHDRNSPARLELPPSAPPRVRYLLRTEAALLIESAGSFHIKVFIVLALSTAARAGALLELTWDRIDFDRGRVNLFKGPRTNKGRAVVPMTTACRTILLEAKKAALTDHVIEYGGQPVASIKKAFARATERAKLEDVTPHTLRHTAAVWMAEAGIRMSEIAQYLGHSSTQVTERVYARFSPEHLRTAAAALEVDLGVKEGADVYIGTPDPFPGKS